jgi:hypothetical protein
MFVKSDIRKITIAFEKAFYNEIYLALGKAGIIHLSRFHERDSMTDAGLQNEESLTKEIISGTEYALNALQIKHEEASVSTQMVDASSNAAFVSTTKRKIERAVRLRAKIREESGVVAQHIEYNDALGRMVIDPGIIKNAKLVGTVFGTVENDVWDVPSDECFMLAKAGRYVFGIALPADVPAMLKFLKEYWFTDKSDSIRQVSLENLKNRVDTLQHRNQIIDRYINHLKEERGQALKQMNSVYRTQEEMLKAMRMSLFSARAMFVTGWMDIRDKGRLIEIMKGICGNRFVVSEQKDPDAPVRLLNMRLFKPFDLLVKNMGMTSNSEIDPTPLAAITFVLMFGLMFGDLGQGIVLMLGGVMLKKFGKKKAREELEQAGGILIACGCSAAICGVLYGSIFSSEDIIPAIKRGIEQTQKGVPVLLEFITSKEVTISTPK